VDGTENIDLCQWLGGMGSSTVLFNWV